MSQEKSEIKKLNENAKLPSWYHPVSSVFIPLGVALTSSVPYSVLKTVQDNKQQGTKTPLIKFRGVGAVAGQQSSRSMYRLGPIPAVKAFAEEHHPDWMSKESSGNIAAAVTIATADVVIGTPPEKLGTEQRTYKPNPEKPCPTFYSSWKEGLNPDGTRSVAKTFEKFYGRNGAVAAAIACRTGVFIPSLMLAKDQIDKQFKPETFEEKSAAALGASVVGGVISMVATPISVVQGRTSRYEKPMGFVEAVKDVAGVGSNKTLPETVSKALKGATSRFGLATLGGAGVVVTMELQKELKESLLDNNNSKGRGVSR